MRRLIKGIVDLVYPPRCCICGRSGPEEVCGVCLGAMPWIEAPVCETCGKPTHVEAKSCRECRGRRFAFSRVRSAGVYEAGLQKAIHQFKYRHRRAVGQILAGHAAHQLSEFAAGYEVVTWVPMTRYKQARRGYNPAELAARWMADVWDRPAAGLLAKRAESQEQSKLCGEKRRYNVRGLFQQKGELAKDVRALLVDDVLTTGATAHECARILKIAGAREVAVVTLARSIQE